MNSMNGPSRTHMNECSPQSPRGNQVRKLKLHAVAPPASFARDALLLLLLLLL